MRCTHMLRGYHPLQQSVGEQYAVRSSMGCGGWASVPWLAVSHPYEMRLQP